MPGHEKQIKLPLVNVIILILSSVCLLFFPFREENLLLLSLFSHVSTWVTCHEEKNSQTQQQQQRRRRRRHRGSSKSWAAFSSSLRSYHPRLLIQTVRERNLYSPLSLSFSERLPIRNEDDHDDDDDSFKKGSSSELLLSEVLQRERRERQRWKRILAEVEDDAWLDFRFRNQHWMMGKKERSFLFFRRE